MSLLIIILNRTFLFLTKAKNQSPLFGAAILVSLLISVSIGNIQLLYYAFTSKIVNNNIEIEIIFLLVTFVMIFLYAKRKEKLITNKSVSFPKKKDFFVASIYIFTIASFIFLANINRDKISKQTKQEQFDKPKKESLEGKIRRWFK